MTKVEDAQETIELTREAFRLAGLGSAWERVIAMVVQPGVEYGDDSLHVYDRQAAAHLSRFIERFERLVFETHSTDYQTRDILRMLVGDHFAVLKVGPALTFAFREAVFALAMMETEWLSEYKAVRLSDILQILDSAMLANPVHWERCYTGSEATFSLPANTASVTTHATIGRTCKSSSPWPACSAIRRDTLPHLRC